MNEGIKLAILEGNCTAARKALANEWDLEPLRILYNMALDRNDPERAEMISSRMDQIRGS